MFWYGASIGGRDIGMNRDMDRRGYVFLRCLCLTPVSVWFFHGIQGSSQHVPSGTKSSSGRYNTNFLKMTSCA